jgi:hypothetical protein
MAEMSKIERDREDKEAVEARKMYGTKANDSDQEIVV